MRPAAVIVLSAGKGTRMKSRIPKALHTLGGRSLVGHAVRTARGIEPERLAVVVGHGRDQVIEHLAAIDPDVEPVVQSEQLGSGHATRVALEQLGALAGTVVVMVGDAPLLTEDTLRSLLAEHARTESSATALTAVVEDPTGFGRMLRTPDGRIAGIVEHRDATEQQQAITEINTGILAFDAAALVDALGKVNRDNDQGEEYLTDVLAIMHEAGLGTAGSVAADPTEVLGVNDRVQLAQLGRLLNQRILRTWMTAGVTVVDPETTWVADTVSLSTDVMLHPNTQLAGDTQVAEGATIGPDSTLTDCKVGADAALVRVHAEGAEIGPRVQVGPYAYLRPGTVLAERAKVGTFVETKQARIGEGSKVPHLTYVGDATLGRDVNIGAGTIFANYDGVEKHHTEIGDAVFVGSDSVLVAPRRLADGSYVAAGSAVTLDVGPGELGVARGRQRNIAGWVQRKRSGTATARAAETAEPSEATESTESTEATEPTEVAESTMAVDDPVGPTGQTE